MEHLLTMKYLNNLYNIESSNPNPEINNLEVINSSLIVFHLLPDEIVLYDLKKEKFLSKKFEKIISLLKVCQENIFIIQGHLLLLLDKTNLDVINTWDIGEKFYYFCSFTSDISSSNIEIIYVNECHEIKFFSKSLLFDSKYRNLYKEVKKVHHISYSNNYLLWTSSYTIKVFDLEKKKMIMRKNYENFFTDRDSEGLEIDVLVFENFLCLNVGKKIIFVYRLNDDSVSNRVTEVFRSEYITNSEELYIGFWLNNSLNKISLLKSFPCPNNSTIYSYNTLKLSIFLLDEASNQGNKIIPLCSKSFENICCDGFLNFSFSHKSTSIFIYDKLEIYNLTLIDRKTKILDDFKQDINFLSNFNDTFSLFNKFTEFNEKCFIVNKIVRNFSFFINDPKIDQSKIFYLINIVASNEKMINYLTILFLHTKNFENYHSWLKNLPIKLNDVTIENVLKYLLDKNAYDIGLNFLNEIKSINLSINFKEFLENKIKSNTEKNIKFINFISNIFLKIGDYKRSLDFLLIIKTEQDLGIKIFDILVNYKCEDLIFTFPETLELFSFQQILKLISNISQASQDNLDQAFTLIFRMKKEILVELAEEIIIRDKIDLISNTEVAENFFEILLFNKKYSILCVFLKNYKNFNYDNILEKYNKIFNEGTSDFNLIEIYILILNSKEDYLKIINTYLEKYRDPELAIQFIENLFSIQEVDRENLYNYLKTKIKESNHLSQIKKFYFINLFDSKLDEDQYSDNTNTNNKINNNNTNNSTNELLSPKENSELPAYQSLKNLKMTEEFEFTENQDDIKYIVLILEQFKLKMKIMTISCHLSIKNLEKEIRRLTIESFKGKHLNLKKVTSCHDSKCIIKNFSKEDKIICYVNCSHYYHKSCLENRLNFNIKEKEENNIADTNKNIPCYLCEKNV